MDLNCYLLKIPYSNTTVQRKFPDVLVAYYPIVFMWLALVNDII